MLFPGLSSCHVEMGALLPAGPKDIKALAHCTTSHPHAHPLAQDQIFKSSPTPRGHWTSSFNTLGPQDSSKLCPHFYTPCEILKNRRRSQSSLCHPHMHMHARTHTHITDICTHLRTCTHTSLQRFCLAPAPGEHVPDGQVCAVLERRACHLQYLVHTE